MGHDPPALVNLIDNLSKLPGIGRKTATRLGLYLLRQPEEKVADLARSIIEVKEKILPSCSFGLWSRRSV